tara:strand:+ start:381 stop:1028 length:648 start_codon:yes stop_codon:yes gene_type:complete
MSRPIERWLEMQNPSIQKSVRAVDCSQPLLHLSANGTIRKFTPRIPKSLYDGEDQTVPRVCVSASLVETLIGAAWNFKELRNQVNFDSLDFVVYGLDVEQAIRPTKKLTQEGVATGELWVVPYRMQMYEIQPSRIATLSIASIMANGEQTTLDLVVDVREEMMLDASTKLKVGFYRLSNLSLADILGKNRNMKYELSAISRDGFLNGKNNLSVSQ